MSEFKFNCPGCGQHILANDKWVGHRINCPSCDTRITVPPPANKPKKAGAAVHPRSPGHRGRRKLPGASMQVERAAKELTKDGPVMPTDQGADTGQPGSFLTGEAGAKEAVTAKGSAPAPEPKRKKEGVAKASAAKEPKDGTVEGVPGKSARPPEAAGRIRIELPVTPPEDGSAPVSPGDSSGEARQGRAGAESAPGTEAESTTAEGEQLRVAVLSPAVKLDLVRAVRLRITDEAGWLPGKVKGVTAYAGKMENGELILVKAKSPDATRFSLIGAFLREMDVRRVVRSATGRRRFLDEEIPETIREVLLERVSDEEREGAEKRLSGQELESISHAQCLAVLAVLERRYLERAEQLEIENAKRRLGSVRLPELVKKLEKKALIKPEEVATALYHELMEVRQRLERLESRSGERK